MHINNRIFIILICAGLFSATSSTVGSDDQGSILANNPFISAPLIVPLQHKVYNLLEDCETRGMIEFKANSRPLGRGEIAFYLQEVLSEFQAQPEKYPLSKREKGELARYCREFYVDCSSISPDDNRMERFKDLVWPKSPFYTDGLNFIKFRREGLSAVVNPILYYDVLTDSTGDRLLHRANGINLKVAFSSAFGFYFDFRDNMERGRGPYFNNERYKLYSDHAGFVNMQGDEYCFYDFTRAVLSAKWHRLILHFGHGDHRWGSGKNSNLLLSANPAPYDYFSANYTFGNYAKFSYLTAVLYPYPEVYSDEYLTPQGWERKLVASKYLSAHRLELYPIKRVEIGLNEAVLYGERGLEPAYLIPFNFFHSAQHNLGDRDNIVWSGDIEVNLIRGASFYGELLIDDLKTSKLGTDFIGNKFGYIGGVHIVNPLRVGNTSLNLEYSRLDPFVYTHFYPINVYKNWNAGLGSDLPPNSERWLVKIRWKPLYSLSCGLAGSYLRHGANTNILNAGGDIDTPPDFGQNYAPFLEGELREDKILEVTVDWEPLENYFVSGTWCGHDFPGGYQNEWRISFGVNVW